MIHTLIFLFGLLAGFVDSIAGACGYAAGSYAGTHLAVKKGAGLIRPLFMIVGLAVILKLLFR